MPTFSQRPDGGNGRKLAGIANVKDGKTITQCQRISEQRPTMRQNYTARAVRQNPRLDGDRLSGWIERRGVWKGNAGKFSFSLGLVALLSFLASFAGRGVGR